MATRSELAIIEGCAGVGMLGEAVARACDWLGWNCRSVAFIEPWWWTRAEATNFAAAEMESWRCKLRSHLSCLLAALES